MDRRKTARDKSRQTLILKRATIYSMFAITPALSALHVFKLYFNLHTNPNETDTVIIPTYGWVWEVKNHSQMKEKLVSGGARNQDLPGSKMWTQEDQVGNYDKTLWRMMWLEDPMSDWLIVCPVHIHFYYIFLVWLSGSSPNLYTNPGQLPVSTLWWTLCIWKLFLWCQRFCNRHPLDLRKGEKKLTKCKTNWLS